MGVCGLASQADAWTKGRTISKLVRDRLSEGNHSLPSISPIDQAVFHEGAEAVGHDKMIALCSNMVISCLNDLEVLSTGSCKEFREVCHSIAGASAVCGAAHLSELARSKEHGLSFSEKDLTELREAVAEFRTWIEREAGSAAD